MSKLCLGIFFKAVLHCKMKSVTQKMIVGIFMHCVDERFDDTDDSMISNLVRGTKNPSVYVTENVNILEEKGYKSFLEQIKMVFKYIDPNKKRDLMKILTYVITADDSIKKETSVDVIGGVTKREFCELNLELENVLPGIFIYILKYTKNSAKDVKEFNEIYLEQILKNNKKAKETKELLYNEDNDDEKNIILARKFCMEYEDEMALLPLCQMAYEINPLHKDLRKIYMEYKLCNSSVRRKIMELNEMPILDFSDKNWVDKCIDKYRKQVHEDMLSSIEFLYEGAKFFHRAYEHYSDCEITEFSPRIFERPFKREKCCFAFKEFPTTLENYIIDYYWYRKEKPDIYIEPPMDYLWNLCDLGNCPEPEMTFWICKFIIASSSQMVEQGDPIDWKWDNVAVKGDLIHTQEDMYYYALLQLYWLYMVDRK